MSLKITPLTGTVGAAVEGIHLEALSDEGFAELRQAFLKHCMLVFRGQHLGPAAQVAFARRWGELVVTPMLSKLQLAEHPEIACPGFKLPLHVSHVRSTSSDPAPHPSGDKDVNDPRFDSLAGKNIEFRLRRPTSAILRTLAGQDYGKQRAMGGGA